jgi:two-component system, NarL family, sensor kinase
VLAELAGELRTASSVDAVANRVGELLMRGTGASGAEVVASRGGEAKIVASSGVCESEPVMAAAVVHDGEELGAVRLFARSPSDLAPDASELLGVVTGSLGAVLRAGQLAEELRGQLVELEHSRARIITAQDQARRQLERDLHDGAQTQLIAIRMRLGIASELAQHHAPGPLRELLNQLGRDTDLAITALRDLSRGLEPPLLATSGIIPALRAGVRGLPLDVIITPNSLARYTPTVEAAVYFCCLEAVRNAATHGEARTVDIQLNNGAGELTFQIQDDGIGFDPDTVVRGSGLINLHDRIAALGGRLTVDTQAGSGTRLLGELPVEPRLDAQPLVSDR